MDEHSRTKWLQLFLSIICILISYCSDEKEEKEEKEWSLHQHPGKNAFLSLKKDAAILQYIFFSTECSAALHQFIAFQGYTKLKLFLIKLPMNEVGFDVEVAFCWILWTLISISFLMPREIALFFLSLPLFCVVSLYTDIKLDECAVMQRYFDLEVLEIGIQPSILLVTFRFQMLFRRLFVRIPDRKRNLRCSLKRQFPSRRDF